ncbi:MAG: Alpha/beta hydrolase fold-3 domain protein [Gammaproteobacteria bacterium]|nr:Alpha/beta hydrolase fold-3 domain protein [Gammaproteobacteria bacterium]
MLQSRGCSRGRSLRRGIPVAALTIGVLLGAALASAQDAPMPPPLQVDADGTVHVPAMTVPVSSYLSPQGKAYLAEHLNQVQRPEMLVQADGVPPLLAGYLQRQRALFAVERQDTTVGGVHAFVYTPKQGISVANRKRVLIDLHGGGFSGCWPGCAELESLPVAVLGRIKVVSLDYREGPKYRFPAASEDVAAAYRELLKTYRAQDIGIYGCSAGGMLTGMSVAWFQSHGLPAPGAVGIFCAGATLGDGGFGFGGDATYTTLPLGESRAPPPPVDAGSKAAKRPGLGYLAETDPHDPLVAPATSAEVLRRFPPTLIITGTRGFELSSAVYTHSQMVKLGVDAELHVWEGMFHGFFYNPDVPESQECYDVIVKFFARHLGAARHS